MNCKNCGLPIHMPDYASNYHVHDTSNMVLCRNTGVSGMDSLPEFGDLSAEPAYQPAVESPVELEMTCLHCDQPIVESTECDHRYFHLLRGYQFCHNETPSHLDRTHVATPKGPVMTDTIDEISGAEVPIPPRVDSTTEHSLREQLATAHARIAHLDALIARPLPGSQCSYSDLVDLHANQAAEILRLQGAERRALLAREQHEEDIQMISDRLNQEAENRGWCSEYETIIEELNEKLNVALAPRKRPFLVTLTYQVTVHVPVDAVDADEACELAYQSRREENMFVPDDETVSIGRWSKIDQAAARA